MFCYGTIFQPVLRLRLSIFVMLLLNTIAAPVHAMGDFQGSVVWRVDNPFHPYGFNLFPDQIQACQTFAEYVSRIHNQPVASIPACYPAGGNGYVQLNTMVDTVSSDGSLIHWTYIAGLAWASCPSNSYPQTGPSMENGVVMPGRCACNTGYQPNSTGTGCEQPSPCQPPDVTDPATGQCVKCTIDPITELPKDDKDFACTQSLDKGAGKDVDGVCPPINAKLTAWNGEMQCFAKKLAALHPPIPYSGPSATIRTKAYQQHLLEVFKNSEKVANLKSEVQKQACAARIAEVEAHMKFHQIKYRPSSKGGAAPHVQGNAFDVPEDVVNALMERVTMIRVKASIAKNHPGCISCMHIPMVTGDVQDYINSAAINPPACKLDWGGRLFVNPSTNKADTVHFQLQNP